MPRGDIGQSHVADSRGRHLHPLVIDVYRRDARTVRGERVGGADVSGVLHAHAIAGIDQDARGEIERFLKSRDDDDLIRRAPHAARRGEILGDRLAQRTVADGVAGEEHRRRRSTRATRGELRPE